MHTPKTTLPGLRRFSMCTTSNFPNFEDYHQTLDTGNLLKLLPFRRFALLAFAVLDDPTWAPWTGMEQVMPITHELGRMDSLDGSEAGSIAFWWQRTPRKRRDGQQRKAFLRELEASE